MFIERFSIEDVESKPELLNGSALSREVIDVVFGIAAVAE